MDPEELARRRSGNGPWSLRDASADGADIEHGEDRVIKLKDPQNLTSHQVQKLRYIGLTSTCSRDVLRPWGTFRRNRLYSDDQSHPVDARMLEEKIR